jgi:hypothetical protein
VASPETDALTARSLPLRAAMTGKLSHSGGLSHDCH